MSNRGFTLYVEGKHSDTLCQTYFHFHGVIVRPVISGEASWPSCLTSPLNEALATCRLVLKRASEQAPRSDQIRVRLDMRQFPGH